ncbi:uncharacterized protein CCR75_006636 [Bremia lactucae]|uniref:Uncharacterized protein n=1 Tax=Bremia lactucae TaxID=4779 RepID=A0A976FD66_BRELC|nr:hypothetical protein CCR75_006636 [Bremia lactucae]
MEEMTLATFLSDRDAAEHSLTLAGLLMFRNEIKEDSREAILTLKKGDIRPVMITGDNAMTGYYIARAGGLVDEGAQIILGDRDRRKDWRYRRLEICRDTADLFI